MLDQAIIMTMATVTFTRRRKRRRSDPRNLLSEIPAKVRNVANGDTIINTTVIAMDITITDTVIQDSLLALAHHYRRRWGVVLQIPLVTHMPDMITAAAHT